MAHAWRAGMTHACHIMSGGQLGGAWACLLQVE